MFVQIQRNIHIPHRLNLRRYIEYLVEAGLVLKIEIGIPA